MHYRKLEHTAALVENEGVALAIDPGCETPLATAEALRAMDQQLVAVLITHAHGDHFDLNNLLTIGRPVFAPAALAAEARAAGIDAQDLVLGEPMQIGPFQVTPVPANHGPMLSNPIENLGFVIQAGVDRVYLTGDMAGPQGDAPTGPFGAVVLPVEGGGFVFEPAEAVAFLQTLDHSGIVVPVHADGSPDKVREFAALASGFCRPVCLGVGESLELKGSTHG